MFHKKSSIVVLATLGALVALTLLAVPALAATSSLIDAINTDPVKDSVVTISGTVESVNDNEFVVSDGTGSITVEAGPSWYKAIVLVGGEEVSVTGEVDTGKDGTKPAEIEAFSITTITTDGTDGSVVENSTITVKGPGKPPWAGGPKISGHPGNNGIK